MSLIEKPLFLDANILLDWAFTTRSWAQHAVHRTHEGKGKLVTSDEAIKEAHGKIDDFVPIVANRGAAHDYFQSRLDILPFDLVGDPPSSDFKVFEGVSGTDQYLLRACLRHDLTLLTSDVPVRLVCSDHGVTAATPLELLDELGFSKHSFEGLRYEREKGSFVFCGILSFFDTSKADEFFEVFRVDDDLFLMANPGQKRWRLQVRDAETKELLSVDAEVADLRGSYVDRKVGASWSDGKLLLIDFHAVHPGLLPLPNGLLVGKGGLHIGGSFHSKSWPQLMIKAIVRDNRPIGKPARRRMRRSPWFDIPHPFDNDRLKRAIQGFLMSIRS